MPSSRSEGEAAQPRWGKGARDGRRGQATSEEMGEWRWARLAETPRMAGGEGPSRLDQLSSSFTVPDCRDRWGKRLWQKHFDSGGGLRLSGGERGPNLVPVRIFPRNRLGSSTGRSAKIRI